MKAKLVQFWNDEEGITALEYGLIAGVMVVALVGIFALLTGGLTTLFTNIASRLSSSVPAS